MYAHLEEMDAGLASILRDQEEIALASKKLIQLMQVDISSVPLTSLSYKVDYDKYFQLLCQEQGFSSLEKLLLEMKKESEKPQQLGLF